MNYENNIISSNETNATRVCSACHKEKPDEDFPSGRKAVNQCRSCIAAMNRRAYYSNINRRAYHIYTSAQKRAIANGLEFSITKEWVIEQLNIGICAATNIPFDFSKNKSSKSKRNPFAPSIDRIDSSRGYTPDNVEMVCLMYNLAKRAWRNEDLIIMAKAMILKRAKINPFGEVSTTANKIDSIDKFSETEILPYAEFSDKERKRLEALKEKITPEIEVPELRRRIIVEDYDLSDITRHEILLYRSNRIDTYRVIVNGKAIPSRLGWARVLELLRKMFFRVGRPS